MTIDIATPTTVAALPGLIMCPACSAALFKVDLIGAHVPAPERLRMKCINTRCDEQGVVKLVPVQVIEVEVEHACADD